VAKTYFIFFKIIKRKGMVTVKEKRIGKGMGQETVEGKGDIKS